MLVGNGSGRVCTVALLSLVDARSLVTLHLILMNGELARSYFVDYLTLVRWGRVGFVLAKYARRPVSYRHPNNCCHLVVAYQLMSCNEKPSDRVHWLRCSRVEFDFADFV